MTVEEEGGQVVEIHVFYLLIKARWIAEKILIFLRRGQNVVSSNRIGSNTYRVWMAIESGKPYCGQKGQHEYYLRQVQTPDALLLEASSSFR